jgi:hypothetical protein
MIEHHRQPSDVSRSLYHATRFVTFGITFTRLVREIKNGHRSIRSWAIWYREWVDLYGYPWFVRQMGDVVYLVAHDVGATKCAMERRFADNVPARRRALVFVGSALEYLLTVHPGRHVMFYAFGWPLWVSRAHDRMGVAGGLEQAREEPRIPRVDAARGTLHMNEWAKPG